MIQLTDTDLQKAAEHVVYEFRQFAHARLHYSALQQTPNPAMALEFRVLHHRILLEFFHTTLNQRQKRNVLAMDYIATWDPSPPVWYKEYVDRCHRMLAHISLDRSSLDREWIPWWGIDDKRDVERHLLDRAQEFLRSLPDKYKPSFSRQFGYYPDRSELLRLFQYA